MITSVADLPDECVTLVFKHPYLLDVAERSERLLHQFVCESAGQSAAVHGAIGRARLVVHFVERQWFGVCWNETDDIVISKPRL